MLGKLNLSDGALLRLELPPAQAKRLSSTCFRGTKHKKAGNFMHWREAKELARNKQFRRELAAKVEALRPGLGRAGHEFRCCLAFDEVIGWESTTPREGLDPYLLEPFRPNHRSEALRLRKTDEAARALRAPQTKFLTLAAQLSFDPSSRAEPRALVCTIFTIYPGLDIGPLDGDISEREGRVFFDWSHPGA